MLQEPTNKTEEQMQFENDANEYFNMESIFEEDDNVITT